MLLRGLALAAVLAAPPVLPSAIEGRVFVDRDGDGRPGAGEAPVPGALVSDGVRIVRADEEGRFRLPLAAGGTVFLLKPAHHAPIPDGEGRRRLWRRVAPGEGPVFFALRPEAESERIVLLADPQVAEPRQIDFVRSSLERPLAAEPAACARVILGDLTADRPALYPALRAALEGDGHWLLALPGNHDLEPGAAQGDDGFRSFRVSFGGERYAFLCGRLRVLMLPGLVPRHADDGRLSGYAADLSEDDLAFAEAFAAATAPDAPTVIATHVPLAPESGFPEDKHRRLLAAFAGSPLAVVAGHWHRQEIRVHPEEGVALFWAVGAVSGSYWTGPPAVDGVPESRMVDGTPRGYGVLEWDDGRFRPRYRPAGASGLAPLHVFLPRVIEQGSYPSALLSVNLHLGHAGSHVRFRVGEGAWQTMERQAAIDPLLLPVLVEQDRATRLPDWRRMPEPRPSTHLWRARLPTDLPPGEQRVEIEAEDGFGGRYRVEASYRLETRSGR